MKFLTSCGYEMNAENDVTSKNVKIKISKERRDPEWDRFVASRPGAHHEQTSLWSEVKSFYGWTPFRIVATRGNQILGGVQVLTKSFRFLGRIGYVTRGPLVAFDDPQLVDTILKELDQAAASEKLTYLAVVPPYNGQVFEPRLTCLGFSRKPELLPPLGLVTATLLLDLSPDLDSLMAGMRKHTRKNIRLAARRGVKVREGTAAEVETFRRLMWKLCERRGTLPTPPQKDFFERLWRVFQPMGFVRLFIAELGGQTVSAAFTIPFGDTVRGWKIAWAGDHAESCPNEMLHWEVIRWAKTNGYRFVDPVAIDRNLALKLLQGDPIDWTSAHGPSKFKIGFGGTPVLLAAPYYRFYHPVLRLLAKTGVNMLIESPPVAPVLGRLLGASASFD